MKRILFSLVLAVGMSLVLTGCGGSSSSSVNITAFEQALQSASGDAKSTASAVVSAVKSSNLGAAADAMEKFAKSGKATPEETSAMSALVIDLLVIAYEENEKYSDDVRNKLSELSGLLVIESPPQLQALPKGNSYGFSDTEMKIYREASQWFKLNMDSYDPEIHDKLVFGRIGKQYEKDWRTTADIFIKVQGKVEFGF
jgi:hypothetical protein